MNRCLGLMFTRRAALIAAVVGIVLLKCTLPTFNAPADDQITAGGKPLLTKKSDYEKLRMAMVKRQLRSRDIKDPDVLRAMEKGPRHEFVPERLRNSAYNDGPLPIGESVTVTANADEPGYAFTKWIDDDDVLTTSQEGQRGKRHHKYNDPG